MTSEQPKWLIQWAGEIVADTPEEAAQKAKEMITNEETTEFMVIDNEELFLTFWTSFKAKKIKHT